MPKYAVNWSKVYYDSGNVEIEADSIEEAEKIARENIGGYQGSMKYDGDADEIEVYELKEGRDGTCEFCGFETHLNPQLCLKLPLFD